jgi:glycosyltransferase involved in cell wall biosynthesis
VFADSKSALSDIVRDSGCGRFVPVTEPDRYGDAVVRAYQDRDDLVAEGQRGRDYVQAHYSKDVVIQQYDALIRDITS